MVPSPLPWPAPWVRTLLEGIGVPASAAAGVITGGGAALSTTGALRDLRRQPAKWDAFLDCISEMVISAIGGGVDREDARQTLLEKIDGRRFSSIGRKMVKVTGHSLAYKTVKVASRPNRCKTVKVPDPPENLPPPYDGFDIKRYHERRDPYFKPKRLAQEGSLHESLGHECLKSSLAFRKPAMTVVSRCPARTEGL